MHKKKVMIGSTVFGICLSAFLCIGVYTFFNAKGVSYLSNDSKACNNCHIMNDVFHDYSNSVHAHTVGGEPRATCSDCHLPHDFIPKWLAKAESGISHAYAFTFKLDSLPTHLSANAKSKEMVQANCIRCHVDTVGVVVNPTTIPGHTDRALSCVSCHHNVGH